MDRWIYELMAKAFKTTSSSLSSTWIQSCVHAWSLLFSTFIAVLRALWALLLIEQIHFTVRSGYSGGKRMILYTFLLLLLLAILRLLAHAEDKAEVNIRVSGACSPSKLKTTASIIIVFNFQYIWSGAALNSTSGYSRFEHPTFAYLDTNHPFVLILTRFNWSPKIQ